MEKIDLIIIGAGAAGLFAAANSTSETLILEKKANPGNKLLIAGQGRCNFTHSGPISAFFSHYGSNGDFIKHALKKYSNKNVVQFFIERGLDIIEDKNGKHFPESGFSKDILDILIRQCHKNGHKLLFNQVVAAISKKEDYFHIQTKSHEFLCKKLIVATGGKSYPATGSSGDGYEFAKIFGHNIIPAKPSLSPVIVKNYLFNELAGVSLKDCYISLYRGDKKIGDHCGDIGFTHKGLSGPGILDFSRYMQEKDFLKMNICGISSDEFNKRFLEEVKVNGKSTIQIFLRQFDIPKALLKNILTELSIDSAEKLGNILKEQRKSLIDKFCEYPFEIERIGGFNVAMATAGGVCLNEVNPKTMESKLQPGLFFAGEVLDIDGDTGGYNLQAAFSTGYMAAVSS